jgi:hypothetical protein
MKETEMTYGVTHAPDFRALFESAPALDLLSAGAK